jgi:hypothetical protein
VQSRPNHGSQGADARVFEAASRFFAALLGAGRINETNQPGILRYCVRVAQQLVAELDGAQAASQQAAAQPAAGDLDLDLELEELAKPEGTAYRSAQPVSPPPGGRPAPPSGVRR